MDPRTSFLITIILALISIEINIWQYIAYSRKTSRLYGSLNAWWHLAKAMREHIDMYWDAVSKGANEQQLVGVAKGTIDGLAMYSSGRLGADIQQAIFALGQADPYYNPFNQERRDLKNKADKNS